MIKWLVDREDLICDYRAAVPEQQNGYKNQLHNALAKRGQEGWEPWHMAVTFSSDGKEYITIYYKKHDDSDAMFLSDLEKKVEDDAAQRMSETLALMPGGGAKIRTVVPTEARVKMIDLSRTSVDYNVHR